MGRAFPAGQLSLGIQTDKTPDEYRWIGARAEELGFDAVTVFADLGFQPPLPALLAMAAATRRIRLGVACWNPTLLHPVEIAGQAAALQQASGGRAYLGLTRGAWLGRIGLPRPAGVAHLGEAVAVIRGLLRGDDSGFAGEHFRLEPGFALRYPLPPEPVPLLLGVWGPRGAGLAARVADAVKIGGCANPAMVQTMRRWLADGCQVAGRPADAVSVVVGAVTVVDEDRQAARSHARTEVAMYLDVVASMDRTVTVDPELLRAIRGRLAARDAVGAGRLIPDDVLDLFAIAGTPQDVAGHAAALFRAGASCVEFGTPHGLTGRAGIDLLGALVVPQVRAMVPGTAPGSS